MAPRQKTNEARRILHSTAIAPTEPLILDAFTSDPAGRILHLVLSKREQGAHVIGLYCGYAPLELIRAIKGIPAFLCASSGKTIAAAEAVLPANLCPLIKSSFGYIRTKSCPFYELSEVVIGETTCDGKKKMFELIAPLKPTHVMDLPYQPVEEGTLARWTDRVRRLKAFLEETFAAEIAAERIEAEIRETNLKCRLMDRVFDYAALDPSALHWSELLDIIAVEPLMGGEEFHRFVSPLLQRLETRAAGGIGFARPGSPRVLVSGCPIGGEAKKVLRIVEEAGGVVVALEGCSGMKGYSIRIDEGTGDPLAAVAAATLKIPCACMTPNRRRFDALDEMIRRFRPHAVIDVILQACHTYNIESWQIERHVQERHGLPFLKIETDYSQSDVEPLRTRIEALLESC
ncbi:MAG: 2-hydroxyglutaryl-CoA dehydratase, D-component [Syntrophaceae bacterium PtaB.Bin038]|nr:MAG: 2-hydroxyglutaryl-CoA dehydratase, D-component [Syntrophaceae bacterium PtaB.Bin038]